MKLSARSRYAARILLELARNTGTTPISAATLSQRTGISVQFIEQILKPLKHNSITSSVRGAAGGHWLAKTAEQISLGDIVRIMEGDISLAACCSERPKKCNRKETCPTRLAWIRASRSLAQELDSISIASLLYEEIRPPKKRSAQPSMADMDLVEAAS